MVPLSRAVYEVVVEQVLKRVQCRGRNVYKMVQAEKHEEQVSLQTWRTPVYVAVPVIGEPGYVAATWDSYSAICMARRYSALCFCYIGLTDHV